MSTRHASALAAMSGRWQRSSANAIRVTRAQLRFEYVGVMHAGRGSSQCRGLWIAPGCARERRHLDAAAVRRCSTSAKGFVCPVAPKATGGRVLWENRIAGREPRGQKDKLQKRRTKGASENRPLTEGASCHRQ